MSDGGIRFGAMRRPMRSLGIAASGLSAQRARMDAIASNLANAETTRTAEGGPYRRQTVQLEAVSFEPLLDAGVEATPGEEGYGGVRIRGVAEDTREGPLVYDPGHPDADESGYVRMPNVSITEEMADLMDARRLFDANATVFSAIKQMLRRATQI